MVVIVCRDRDYTQAIASLKQHKHTIVAIAPSTSGAKEMVDYLIDWDDIEANIKVNSRPRGASVFFTRFLTTQD